MLAYDSHFIAFILSFVTYVWIPKQYDLIFPSFELHFWSYLFY